MSRALRRAAIVAVWPTVLLVAAACGSSAPTQPPSTPAVPLETSLTTTAGTWATVVMGGRAAQHNNFWQLFERTAAGSRWKLVTPPGTADNGGLILAPATGQTLIAAFRPSQHLTYTPLIRTANAGRAWSSLSPLDAALIGTPDSLASREPSDGRLLALTGHGTVQQSADNAASWTTLTTLRALAVTSAGRRCGLTGLTAAAYTASGTPLLAGTCSRPGTAGIFALAGQKWRAIGPALPASLAGRAVSVLHLVTIGNENGVLLAAGNGHDAALLVAWSSDGGVRWIVSPVLRLGGNGAPAASFGQGQTAAVVISGGRGAVIAAGRWRVLPTLPRGTATLVPGPGGVTEALAVHHSTLTVWQLGSTAANWTKVQVITVPIEYGSSS
jgi:hypothetical protein